MRFISKILNKNCNKMDRSRFSCSYSTALYAARRITKCKCVEKCVTNIEKKEKSMSIKYGFHNLILDYALSQPIEHGCKYKDYPCDHCPSAIECYECFIEDTDVLALVKTLQSEQEDEE